MDERGCLVSPDVTPQELKDLRLAIGISQKEFSEAFNVPLKVVQKWEEGAQPEETSSFFTRVLKWCFGTKKPVE